MREHNGTLRVFYMLVQTHTRPALPQDARQRRLAHLDRLPPEVSPVQLQQINGIVMLFLMRLTSH
jgi:hypothetical protein